MTTYISTIICTIVLLANISYNYNIIIKIYYNY